MKKRLAFVLGRGGFEKPKTANRTENNRPAAENNRTEKKPKPNIKNRTEPNLFGFGFGGKKLNRTEQTE
jgi:hypothetical protein